MVSVRFVGGDPDDVAATDRAYRKTKKMKSPAECARKTQGWPGKSWRIARGKKMFTILGSIFNSV